MTLTLLMLVACGDKDAGDDTSSSDDTSADTSGDTSKDTDTGSTDELGFTWTDAWYPLVDGSMFCQVAAGFYTFSGGSLRDGDGAQGNGYAYFADVPTPGTYTVVPLDPGPGPGQVTVGVADYQNGFELWFSDGASGTVTVTEVDGALDVQWDATSLQLSGSATVQTTPSGHMRCTPE